MSKVRMPSALALTCKDGGVGWEVDVRRKLLGCNLSTSQALSGRPASPSKKSQPADNQERGAQLN